MKENPDIPITFLYNLYKFDQSHWEDALRRGYVWLVWINTFTPGVLLLFMMSQCKENLRDIEGDLYVAWDSNLSVAQMGWIYLYLETCIPSFIKAAKFLEPWVLPIYEKGCVTADEHKEIIDGLKQLGLEIVTSSGCEVSSVEYRATVGDLKDLGLSSQQRLAFGLVKTCWC